MRGQSKLFIPPQWKKSLLCFTGALLIFWIEHNWGPLYHLSSRPAPRFIAILLLFCALYLSMSVQIYEKIISIKLFGIAIRNVFWFEVSDAVFSKGKNENSGGIMYLSRYPLLSVKGKKEDAFWGKILHPINVIMFYVPRQLEDDCIGAFSELCKNFDIRNQ